MQYSSPIFETEVKGRAYSVTLHLYRQLPMPLPMVSPYTRDRDLSTWFEAREKRQLHTCRVAEDAKNRFETGFESLENMVQRAV